MVCVGLHADRGIGTESTRYRNNIMKIFVVIFYARD